ncbi:MAG: DNA recombination protein RmuC [Actinomycetes bacterium]|jgi:DNA recombination protein RmuC|nr:DNA recombination protein RmuC [Actinomycetes bacterium]
MTALGRNEVVIILLLLAGLAAIVVLLLTVVPSRLRDSVAEPLARLRGEVGERLSQQALEQEQRLEHIRTTLDTKLERLNETTERNLKTLSTENTRALDAMRHTVDEKLQQTLEDRITRSFQLVNEQLEQVHKGLGEMQSLAVGVGDLKKTLSNVKTRGILGEIQLGAILEQIMAPGQYLTDTPIRKGAGERVEFAIRMPGDEESEVLLPIDSKFPLDRYQELLDAYETADKDEVARATKALNDAIKVQARFIRDKYIQPPFTTEFAILFLPVEGLYAEVVRGSLFEELAGASFRVNIAGPSTMAALLNSLQMGFRTLAIRKRSGEIWKVLENVRREFTTFETVLDKARDNIRKTDEQLEKLIGVRTRQINRHLDKVVTYEDGDAKQLPQG